MNYFIATKYAKHTKLILGRINRVNGIDNNGEYDMAGLIVSANGRRNTEKIMLRQSMVGMCYFACKDGDLH